jgi:hypothetical protein
MPDPVATHRAKGHSYPVHRARVDSSVLRSVGYDQQGTLEVEFHNGRVYHYFVVPNTIYQELMSAPSLGRYFNDHIRNRYPDQRLV